MTVPHHIVISLPLVGPPCLSTIPILSVVLELSKILPFLSTLLQHQLHVLALYLLFYPPKPHSSVPLGEIPFCEVFNSQLLRSPEYNQL